jgi:hypothetical protein
MRSIFDFFNQGWIGLLIGVVSIAVAYVLYRRSLLRPSLAFFSSSIQVTGVNSPLVSGIEIFFRGKKVETVTQSTIIIYNAGNTTIDGDRIVNSDPLRIVTCEGSEILEAAIADVTRKVNSFSIAPSEQQHNEAICAFDYLDTSDGALIKVLHTGGKATVAGTVRGMAKGLTPLGSIPSSFDRADNILLSIMIGLIVGGFIVIAILIGVLNLHDLLFSLAVLGAFAIWIMPGYLQSRRRTRSLKALQVLLKNN